MKKIFTIASLAILALASCSKAAPEAKLPETDEPMEINFQAYNYLNATKAASPIAFTGKDFGAFAYFTKQSWKEAPSLDDVYMKNAQITKSAGEWVPVTKYYWPKDGNLDFVCYSPYTASSPMTYTLDKGVTFPNYTVDGATDLMWSDIAIDQTQQKMRQNAIDGKAGVYTLFHHALTRIAFEFALDNSKPEEVKSVEITLRKASIVNIRNKGSFEEKNAEGRSAWNGQSGSMEYEIFNGTKTLAVEADSKDCKGYIVLPQVLADKAQQLKLTYDIRIIFDSNDAQPTTLNMTNELVNLSCEAVPAWNINKNILYTIKISAFSKEPITFYPEEMPWDEKDAAEIDIR